MNKRETNSDHDIEKKIICKYSISKECLNKILFLEIVSVMKINHKLFISMCIKCWYNIVLMIYNIVDTSVF